MQQLRSIGRVLSVLAGSLVAITLIRQDPSSIVLSIAAVVAVAAACGTRGSRWYVTSAFTTFLVFVLLLYSRPTDAQERFLERLGETLLGVGAAFVFGLMIPRMRQRPRRDGPYVRS